MSTDERWATGSAEERRARALDAADPLARFRSRFHVPLHEDGQPVAYFCGNSLGLQPVGVQADVVAELEDWQTLAVRAHLEGRDPWYPYHRQFREPMARLVGARPEEVVLMNGLTVNLHLMMVSFYRPEGTRRRILMEDAAFSSDRYAVETQLRVHGVDPADGLIAVPATDGACLDEAEIERRIEDAGDTLALVLLGGVNFLTGQRLDLARIARAAHAVGARVGFDLAHAAGNVPLSLHDDGADFAVWCTYKYLNAGPGAVAGCFVHERHAHDRALPRFGGWWGYDPDTRFQLHLRPDFVPVASADGWQLSNPPILALAPLKASLALFDEAGLPALRAKSVALTGYLESLLDTLPAGRFRVLTPRDPERRGAQLSLQVEGGGARALEHRLMAQGIVCDAREPDVLRASPAPLYNTFQDVWRLAAALADEAAA
ncbi:MAG: kynureninase [Gemmatimonadota bacterium]|nr:kynureninase [Gemmatimonadota bacterium]